MCDELLSEELKESGFHCPRYWVLLLQDIEIARPFDVGRQSEYVYDLSHLQNTRSMVFTRSFTTLGLGQNADEFMAQDSLGNGLKYSTCLEPIHKATSTIATIQIENALCETCGLN